MYKENSSSFYISSINAAIDYIESNIDRKLNLEDISKAAGLSRFHFHRIFRSYMKETLNDFVRRLRIQKAAMMLFTNPKYSITKIAFLNGFSSSQALSREFRVFFKTTPQKYRQSKIRYKYSKNGKSFKIDFHYHENRNSMVYYNPERRNGMKVVIKDLPDKTLAYIRHIGPYKGDSKLFANLFEKLCCWAGPRDLLAKDTVCYCIYYDGPEVTDESKLRIDVCIDLPNGSEVSGEIGKQEIKGGKYAVARCMIRDPKEYEKYWTELYTEWLPSSGFQPDNKPPFEMYPPDCKKENSTMVVDICIPVKPA